MKTVRLGDVADINPRADKIPQETPVSFVGMAELDAHLASASARNTVPYSEVSKGYTQFRNNDLLVAKITPCWENGKIGQAVIPTRNGSGSTEFHVVRPHEDVDERYMLHFLRQGHLRATGTLRMTGSGGQRRVPSRFIEQLEIPLPPLDEQRRIAATLDSQQRSTKLWENIYKKVEQLESSIFDSLFATEIRESRLGDLIADLQGGKSVVGPENSTNPYRVLKISATTSGNYMESETKPLPEHFTPSPSSIVKSGDVLISRANTSELVGASAIVKNTNGYTVLPDKLWRATPASGIEPLFLHRLLSSHESRREISRSATGSGGSMKNISKAKLLAIPAFIPSGKQQEKLRLAISKTSNLKILINDTLTTQRELSGVLQSHAFRGEL